MNGPQQVVTHLSQRLIMRPSIKLLGRAVPVPDGSTQLPDDDGVIGYIKHSRVAPQLLFGLSNSGQPLIHVVDGNFGNRGELCLAHQFEGLEIDMRLATETMKHLEVLWGRPVHVETKLDGKGVLVSCAKGEVTTKEVAPSGETDRKEDPTTH